jgi:MFS family permease
MTTDTATRQAGQRVTYREVFAVGEWRALWLAQLASIAGDQFARVALAVLVFDRTRSPLLAAITFAATAGAMFAGGLLLGWTADRYPRRRVMLACDVTCAGLVAVMLIPGVPLGALIALLFLVGLAVEPFLAARMATNAEVLGEARFQLGQGVTIATYQVAQLGGFALGGIVTGTLGVRAALAVDAASFAVSALLIRFCVRTRPAPGGGGPSRPQVLAGARIVFANPATAVVLGLLWLAAFYGAPEGVTVPLSRQLGGGATTAGVLLAASAAGAALGPLIYTRLIGKTRRTRYLAITATAACAVLAEFAIPGIRLGGALAILAVSGLLTGYIPAASGELFKAIPDEHRGKAGGVVGAGMSLGQALGIVIAGAVAQRVSPALVIALVGAAGTICGVPLIMAWHRLQGKDGSHA